VTAADEPLRRLGGGRWQTRDDRFTIEPQGGTWSLVDAVHTDELGMPLIRGPFRSLTAAKEAIAAARTGMAPESPLGERSAAITPLAGQRPTRRGKPARSAGSPARAGAEVATTLPPPATTTARPAAPPPGPAPELPDGLSVETLYVIEAPYTPDAAERRPAVRREHLEHAAELMAAGRLVVAGGYSDLSVALLFVRAADEAEARALVSDDIYVREGVWTGEFRIRPYTRVVQGPAATGGRRR
jgi:hypothetical protein